jgi:hypothetical protein
MARERIGAETFPGAPFATQHMVLSPYMRVDSGKKKKAGSAVSETLTMPAENAACVRVRLAGSQALAQLAVAWYAIRCISEYPCPPYGLQTRCRWRALIDCRPLIFRGCSVSILFGIKQCRTHPRAAPHSGDAAVAVVVPRLQDHLSQPACVRRCIPCYIMVDWLALDPAAKLGEAVADTLMANITSEYVVPYEVGLGLAASFVSLTGFSFSWLPIIARAPILPETAHSVSATG